MSAFLSLCGLIVPFSEAPDTLIPFLLILSPIYINKKSKILCFILILIAIFWPLNSRKNSNSWLISIDDNDIIMRILLLIDSVYMFISFKKAGKYKMTPSQIENNQFPIVIWVRIMKFLWFININFKNDLKNITPIGQLPCPWITVLWLYKSCV